MASLEEAISAALTSFRKLDQGRSAPTVMVRAQDQHVSASWREDLTYRLSVANLESCPELDSCPRHYVVIRSDLPLGTLAAMIVHAAGETGPASPETRAVVLCVPDEASLLSLFQTLEGCHLITEPDAPWNGQAMAIGFPPASGRRPELSHLPLLGNK